MSILTKSKLRKMEEYYYWSGKKNWVPFPDELNNKILEIYGVEPLPYEWSEQDIYQGSRNIILDYFSNKRSIT
ncbi:hypothetical protein [Ruoffia sp. FAM 26254]|uniref:hypothetical protein n=1 Tax=unclassified Ruoffia TaxID=2862149 RepID=UPI003889B84F